MENVKYLELLSQKYSNRQSASAEIINLNAILALPKGTEYYLSDLHGEFEAFKHMIPVSYTHLDVYKRQS